ncbi:hypothetical protein BC937DRAFT_89930 [Endogone sp. FLAS-F59071]|nr:hypothetical protein BC937DRAFT_89930 [Endogone sp. FLAS-F59071]|eukprot:RUS22239.1 hypothetical protein BC937DRAFT_89930 [Endogone sp. FLAS-F59071]
MFKNKPFVILMLTNTPSRRGNCQNLVKHSSDIQHPIRHSTSYQPFDNVFTPREVAIVTGGSVLGSAGVSAYSASKAALEAMSRIWAAELGPN